ncbi:uncharacterized protein B0T23DRAFT_130242 [Neurospora hispaniola]|uniref:Uncharacterized protein n=1 Tax=Neurospora hispaniola TaxID=588809 RepID=A0AAJ0IB43_9PEZI|nr:hypothetical protein B0T23DRAFT_130242 [Neurospora hispaniola]
MDRQTGRSTDLLACLLACLLVVGLRGFGLVSISPFFPFLLYSTLLLLFSQTSCLLACLLVALCCAAQRARTHTHTYTHTLHYKNIQQLLHLPFFSLARWLGTYRIRSTHQITVFVVQFVVWCLVFHPEGTWVLCVF